jgi:hypothetical protein
MALPFGMDQKSTSEKILFTAAVYQHAKEQGWKCKEVKKYRRREYSEAIRRTQFPPGADSVN